MTKRSGRHQTQRLRRKVKVLDRKLDENHKPNQVWFNGRWWRKKVEA